MSAPTRTRNILYVEDHETLRELVRIRLALLGNVRTCLAANAHEALGASDELPDAAILDLSLPDMDGLELIRRLRARSADLCIVVYSGAHQLRDAAIEAGADGFALKGRPIEELMELVTAR